MIYTLSEWLIVNSLKLNVSKTKSLLFNHEGLCPRVDLEVDCQVIETVNEFKFLGIWLDPSLSFECHFRTFYDRLIKLCFVIRSLSRILPSYTLRYLYFAYYHSHLTNCLPIWYPLLNQGMQNSLYAPEENYKIHAWCQSVATLHASF